MRMCDYSPVEHDIVFHSPATAWHNGLPLGNGDMAAISYNKGKDYVLGITKIDVWDMRFKRRKPLTPHKRILELIKKKDWKTLNYDIYREENKPYEKDPFPSPKPCGEIKIKGILSSNNSHYEERLSLAEAAISCRTESTEVHSFVYAHGNLLVIRCKSKKTRLVIELARWEDRVLGKPEISSDSELFWVDYPFPDGFRYVMMGKIAGADFRVHRENGRVRVALHLREETPFYIYISVATSLEAKNPWQKAKDIIQAQLKRDYLEILSEHDRWWQSFWGKSFIDIPDKFLENLWYYQLYLLASSSRGRFPVPSGCHIWDMKDVKPWHGDYHTNDTAIIYWSIFAGNHLELSKPFYRNFYEVLPRVIRDTQTTFGINGAKYAFSPMPTGQEIAGGYWRYEIYGSAWVSQMFWWYYLYSQDKEFLRKKGYRVIMEVLRFYEGYLQKDKIGRYYIFPCHPVEQMPQDKIDERTTNWEKNVLIDLAMLKDLLKAGIKASRILRKDKEKAKKWGEILNNLSEYPNNGEVFLEYEGAPPDFKVHHADIMSAVFPCGEIGLDSEKEVYQIAKRTFESLPCHTIRQDKNPPFPILTWCDEFNWCWLACIAARLGLGDDARKYIYDMGILFHLKKNGFFSIGFRSEGPEEREKETIANLKSNTGLGMAINEMLLQSYSGVIRVFPAIPHDWKNCSFRKFRAVGAFLVSSEISNQEVRYIIIESKSAGKCTLANPWGMRKVNVWDFKNKKLIVNKKVLKRSSGKIIKFIAREGTTYLIKKEGEGFETVFHSRAESKKSLKRRQYKGPKYLGRVDEAKMWLVELGK